MKLDSYKYVLSIDVINKAIKKDAIWVQTCPGFWAVTAVVGTSGSCQSFKRASMLGQGWPCEKVKAGY